MKENIAYHWKPSEESDASTFPDMSLRSKMSTIKLDHDVMDMLRAKKSQDSINMTKWASAILRKELIKEVSPNEDFKS